ncbi:MAG TPA: alpha/beta hydrolase [Candidatus Limnocylindrales bacterium]|nr:alpha/beta hydrolase [Candidatus Limnocylindrales bacterium]
MASQALQRAVDGPAGRLRLADEALWRRHGLVPMPRTIELARPSIRLRVLEVGSGTPLLFVHGTVGPGGWPSLAEALPGHRLLLLDRPGWGGSDPVDYRGQDYHALAADILGGVLDAYGLERATIVGASIGDVWALSLARLAPARVERVVLLGAGPLVREVERPGFIRLLASPLGALIVRLPMSADRTRSILRDSGHGPSMADGRIPEEFVAWRVTMSNDSAAMRRERAMIRAVVAGSDWSPDLTFSLRDLRSIRTPTLLVYGSADPVGSVALWRRFMSELPNGSLEVVQGAGHMPWFDEPQLVASLVDRFLAGSLAAVHGPG